MDNTRTQRKNWKLYLTILVVVSAFAIVIQKGITIPAPILYTTAVAFMLYLLFHGISRPEVIIYALVAYLPFSKVLVGDFGHAFSAVNLTNILTIIAIIALFVQSAVTGKRMYIRTSLDIPLLIFIFFGFLSLLKGTVFFGFDYAFDFITPLKRWLTPMFFFFITLGAAKEKRVIKNVVFIIGVVVTITALMSIKDYIDVGEGSSLEDSRIGGIAGGPNGLAAFFVYYMFIFLGFIFVYGKNIRYWALWIPFILCFRGIQVTFSRGGYLAFAAALLAVAFFRKKFLFVALLALLFFLYTHPQFLPKGMRSRMESTFVEKPMYATSIEETIDKSAAKRIMIWKGALQMIKDNPWFGVGYGVFPHMLPYYVPELGRMDAHNQYLLIAAEMGVFALLAFIWVLLVIIKNTYKLYKITRDKFFKAMSLGFLGGLGGLLVANMFGGRLDSQEISSYLWILAALVFRALQIEREEAHVSKSHP